MRRHAKAVAAALTLLGTLILGVALAAAVAPTVSVENASEVRYTTAKVKGEVDPQGQATTYRFQYATQADFSDAATGIEGQTETPETLEGQLSGLQPATIYFLRLVAENADGPAEAVAASSFETEAVAKPIVSIAIPSGVTDSAAHFEGTVNPNAPAGPLDAATEAAYETTYSFSCSPGCPGLEGPQTIAADNASHPVQDDASGLLPNQNYEVTLSASNAGGTETATASFVTEGVEPDVETNAVHGFVSDDTARFLGTVNPRNSPVQSCLFEYGTTTAYGQSVPCESYPEANEAGNDPYVVGAEAEGLDPETTYHFRLLVDNGTGGPAAGEDRTLATQATPKPQGPCPNEEIRIKQEATYLPDCMAYELVSPADTGGTSLDYATGAPDGIHAYFGAVLPLSQNQPSANIATYEVRRTASGWVSHDLADPATPGNMSYQPVAISEDTTHAVVEVCLMTGTACSGDIAYQRVDSDGTRTIMVTIPGIPFGTSPPKLVGGSDDLSRIFFLNAAGSPPLLSEDTHTEGRGLYGSDDGELEFIGVDDTGDALPCGAVVADDRSFVIGNGFQQSGVSADGRTVAFESPDPEQGPGCAEPIALYLHHDGHSIDISSPRPGDPAYGAGKLEHDAAFVGMSQDGEVVYFTTLTQLDTISDTDANADLYRYNVATDTVTDLVPGAAVDKVAVSPKGDYLYFLAENQIDGEGVAGQTNLVAYHDGETNVISSALTGFGIGGGMTDAGRGSPITPDGTHLLFLGVRPLTGQPTGGADYQYFQYDAEARELTCVSCPGGDLIPTSTPGRVLPHPATLVYVRYQSDDGSRVFFNSKEALSPQDTNSVSDVYLWHDGVTSLISGGTDDRPSSSGSMSADGGTVFFQTSDRLIAGIRQDSLKLFAARAQGGFAEPMPEPRCSGDACKGSPSVAPSPPGTASAFFVGPGNPKSRHYRKHHKRHRKRHTKRAVHTAGSQR